MASKFLTFPYVKLVQKCVCMFGIETMDGKLSNGIDFERVSKKQIVYGTDKKDNYYSNYFMSIQHYQTLQ